MYKENTYGRSFIRYMKVLAGGEKDPVLRIWEIILCCHYCEVLSQVINIYFYVCATERVTKLSSHISFAPYLQVCLVYKSLKR